MPMACPVTSAAAAEARKTTSRRHPEPPESLVWRSHPGAARPVLQGLDVRGERRDRAGHVRRRHRTIAFAVIPALASSSAQVRANRGDPGLGAA